MAVSIEDAALLSLSVEMLIYGMHLHSHPSVLSNPLEHVIMGLQEAFSLWRYS